MQHLPLDFTPTNSTPPAPTTEFTCHTNNDQLIALQQNPTNGINPTTSPMTNGYHQSTNTTIQPPSDSKEGNPSSGKSLCNDSAASVQLPQTTTNNTQNYQMPYSRASQYINFCKTHDTLGKCMLGQSGTTKFDSSMELRTKTCSRTTHSV